LQIKRIDRKLDYLDEQLRALNTRINHTSNADPSNTNNINHELSYMNGLLSSLTADSSRENSRITNITESLHTVSSRLSEIEVAIATPQTFPEGTLATWSHTYVRGLSILRNRHSYWIWEEGGQSGAESQFWDAIVSASKPPELSNIYRRDKHGFKVMTDIFKGFNSSSIRDQPSFETSTSDQSCLNIIARNLGVPDPGSNSYIDYTSSAGLINKFSRGYIVNDDGNLISSGDYENQLDEYFVAYTDSVHSEYATGYIGALASDVAAGVNLESATINGQTIQEVGEAWSTDFDGAEPSSVPVPRTFVWDVITQEDKERRFASPVGERAWKTVSQVFSGIEIATEVLMGFIVYTGGLATGVGKVFGRTGLVNSVTTIGTEMVETGQLVGIKLGAWKGLEDAWMTMTSLTVADVMRQVLPQVHTVTNEDKSRHKSIGFIDDGSLTWSPTIQERGVAYVESVQQNVIDNTLAPDGLFRPASGWRIVLDIVTPTRMTSDSDWTGNVVKSKVNGLVDVSVAMSRDHNVILYDGQPVLTKRTSGGVVKWFPTAVVAGVLQST
jgi:hypothetical protein